MEIEAFLIGSRAMEQHFPGFALGRGYDIDLITTYSYFDENIRPGLANLQQRSPTKYVGRSFLKNAQVEVEIADKKNSAAKYLDYINYLGEPLLEDSGFYCAPLEVLFSIVKSHIYYPLKWEKHIKTYSVLKKRVGEDKLPGFTTLRAAELEERVGKLKTPSLMKNKDDFFEDNVNKIRVFEHDDMHAVMAHYEAPLFESLKENAEKVTCSRAKWEQLEWGDKIKCVLEEAYVIALERRIVPALYLSKPFHTAEMAIKYALQRICTNLCGGWFRQFALDNYFELLENYDREYVKKFLDAVEAGKIKRIDKYKEYAES